MNTQELQIVLLNKKYPNHYFKWDCMDKNSIRFVLFDKNTSHYMNTMVMDLGCNFKQICGYVENSIMDNKIYTICCDE